MNSDSLKIRKNFEFKGGRTITKERERDRQREGRTKPVTTGNQEHQQENEPLRFALSWSGCYIRVKPLIYDEGRTSIQRRGKGLAKFVRLNEVLLHNGTPI